MSGGREEVVVEKMPRFAVAFVDIGPTSFAIRAHTSCVTRSKHICQKMPQFAVAFVGIGPTFVYVLGAHSLSYKIHEVERAATKDHQI